MGRLTALLLLCCGAAFFCTVSTWADEDDDVERIRELREHGRILPLGEILRRLGIGNSILLEVEFEEHDGRPVYELEFVDGKRRVRKVSVDARTGKPLPEGWE